MSGESERKGDGAIKRYLAFEDSPKFFSHPISWLYYAFGIIYALIPIGFLATGIRFRIFSAGSSLIISFILILIGAIAASLVVLLIWWNRRKIFHTEVIATPVVLETFTYLFKTLWETFFTWTAIFGTIAGIISLVLEGDRILGSLGIGFASGVTLLIGSLVGGYVAVLLSKYVALLFHKILELIIYVVKRVLKFLGHVIAQLFEFVFIFYQSLVDFLVNGWRVVVALVAHLGKYLLAYSAKKDSSGISPSGGASITYNS
jgi:hypothetical protein